MFAYHPSALSRLSVYSRTLLPRTASGQLDIPVPPAAADEAWPTHVRHLLDAPQT